MAHDLLNMFLSISGVFVFIAMVVAVLALVFRRFSIWQNKKLYKDKAESIEPNQIQSVKNAFKYVFIAWCIVILIGVMETIAQHL